MYTSPEKIHFYIRININNISYENSTFLNNRKIIK